MEADLGLVDRVTGGRCGESGVVASHRNRSIPSESWFGEKALANPAWCQASVAFPAATSGNSILRNPGNAARSAS